MTPSARRHISASGSGSAYDAGPSGGGERVRIVDLAQELQLSVATVSRALNHVPTVDDDIAQQVRDLAERRGYVANRLARSLRMRTPPFVGFLVPDVENLAYSIAVDACAKYVGQLGYQLILVISGDDSASEYAALRSLAEAQVAGLIVAPSPDMSEESRALLAGRSVVQFNRDCGLSDYTVVCDDRPAFADATRHLLELGHTRFAYVGTTDVVSNGRDRLEGVRGELSRAGRRLSNASTRLLPPTETDGYAAAYELFTTGSRPTALVVGSSNLSMGVARAVRELGIAIPQEMSLVVYGDDRWGGLYEPGLTTITAPYREMARTVADIVTELLSGGRRPRRGPVRLPAELVIRGSIAPAPPRSR
ncbi:MAG: LacI family DNA-binding transcriptional regulator [Propionibacteriales bacterium]|nr:LacI family DNA-binding transcriptional regulator [Propionibacteriales bacterium]